MTKRIANNLLNTRISGATRVATLLQSYAAIGTALFAKQQLQRLMLERTKARFLPSTRKEGQKDPKGKPWRRITRWAYRARKKNKRHDQALVDRGNLRRSIAILNGENIRASSLTSPTGAGFSIGVKAGTKASKYARLQNFGGTTFRGHRVPARRFLGVGPSDVAAVDLLIKSLVVKAARGAL